MGVLILSQRTSPFPVKPGRQIQLMVLNGRVLWTIHSEFWAHGLITSQGLSHSPSKHACLLGHSRSSLHPGSGGGGTEKYYNIPFFDTLISFKLQIRCKYTGMNVMSIKLRGSYWDYMQCRTDRLWSQVYNYKFLCDSEDCNRHFVHNHKDLHIFHFYTVM